MDSGDDAAVWRVDADRALVATVDIITPIVDDPHVWGRIAAANSVSDVYAMGGRPLFALNVACWNSAELSTDLLGEVLAGAGEVAAECGFVIAGGHTIDDPEPKFGLSVVGEVHPDRLLRNTGLRNADVLVLTKPLGTGVVATAAKAGHAATSVLGSAVESMSRTNATAAAVAARRGATGVTDVTGFGLLGHLGQMASASGVSVDIETASVPLLPGAAELATAGYVPGGTMRNLQWVDSRLERGAVDQTTLTLLADAQTSGGLIFGVSPDVADATVAELASAQLECAIVGVAAAGDGTVRLR